MRAASSWTFLTIVFHIENNCPVLHPHVIVKKKDKRCIDRFLSLWSNLNFSLHKLYHKLSLKSTLYDSTMYHRLINVDPEMLVKLYLKILHYDSWMIKLNLFTLIGETFSFGRIERYKPSFSRYLIVSR